MTLPISPSFPPMEASFLLKIPSEGEWQYEPNDNVKKANHSIAIPQVVEPLQQLEADRYVLDREIVISPGEIFSFGDLLQRIHRCIGDDFCLTAADR